MSEIPDAGSRNPRVLTEAQARWLIKQGWTPPEGFVMPKPGTNPQTATGPIVIHTGGQARCNCPCHRLPYTRGKLA